MFSVRPPATPSALEKLVTVPDANLPCFPSGIPNAPRVCARLNAGILTKRAKS